MTQTTTTARTHPLSPLAADEIIAARDAPVPTDPSPTWM